MTRSVPALHLTPIPFAIVHLPLQSLHCFGKPFHVNFQPLDPLDRRLITIGLIAPFSRRGPVTFVAPFARLPVRAVLLSLSALVSFTMDSCAHLLSQTTNRVSPLFVTELAPQS